MKESDDWWVVKSKVGKTLDDFPCGEFLCRSKIYAEEAMQNLQDPIMEKYIQKNDQVTQLVEGR